MNKLLSPGEELVLEHTAFTLEHPELTGFLGDLVDVVLGCDDAKDIPFPNTPLEKAYQHVQSCKHCRRNLDVAIRHQKDLYHEQPTTGR